MKPSKNATLCFLRLSTLSHACILFDRKSMIAAYELFEAELFEEAKAYEEFGLFAFAITAMFLKLFNEYGALPSGWRHAMVLLAQKQGRHQKLWLTAVKKLRLGQRLPRRGY